MSVVVELVRDNLYEYMSDELPDKYTVVIVNCERHIKSNKYMPGGIERYPTVGFYNKGYFIKEVDTNLILTKQFK